MYGFVVVEMDNGVLKVIKVKDVKIFVILVVGDDEKENGDSVIMCVVVVCNVLVCELLLLLC